LAIHAALLEPADFRQRYAAVPAPPDDRHKDKRGKPTWNRTYKEHKAAWAAFEATLNGRKPLPAEDWAYYEAVRASLAAHPIGAQCLACMEAEVSIQWRDGDTGLLCKARLDGLIRRPKGILVVDLKSCQCAAPAPFGRVAYRYGYHFQLAMYADGAKAVCGKPAEPPLIIAIEKAPPYAVAVYAVGELDMDLGRAQYISTLRKLKACRDADDWPAYSNEVMDLQLPAWAGQDFDGAAQPAPPKPDDDENLDDVIAL
jgi:hypothetical protein